MCLQLCTIRHGERSTDQWLRCCSIHAVDAPFKNDDYALAECEVARELRILFQQREALIARKSQHSFRQLGLRLQLRTGPHAFNQIDPLASGPLHHTRASVFRVDRVRLLLRTSDFTLLHGRGAANNRYRLRCGRGRIFWLVSKNSPAKSNATSSW